MDQNRFRVLDKLNRTRPVALREPRNRRATRLIADTHNWLGKEAYASGRLERRRGAASRRRC